MGREREYPLWTWWLPKGKKTQHTRPKGTDEHGQPAEPMEIPVPKREDVEDALDRLIEATPEGGNADPDALVPQDESAKKQGDELGEQGDT